MKLFHFVSTVMRKNIEGIRRFGEKLRKKQAKPEPNTLRNIKNATPIDMARFISENADGDWILIIANAKSGTVTNMFSSLNVTELSNALWNVADGIDKSLNEKGTVH